MKKFALLLLLFTLFSTVAHIYHIFSKKLNWSLVRTDNFITAH